MDYVSYAGDLTPEQAWELLRENPDAVLVDVRTDAEWKYVGVPDVVLPRQAGRTDRMGEPPRPARAMTTSSTS